MCPKCNGRVYFEDETHQCYNCGWNKFTNKLPPQYKLKSQILAWLPPVGSYKTYGYITEAN